MRSINIIGVMDGSSMDGLDVALCQFYLQKKQIHYQILRTASFNYSKEIAEILKTIRNTSSEKFFEYDVKYGKFVGKKIRQWMDKYQLQADAISIHGHTVFHYPERGFSVQLGNAAQIAAICQLPVVHNYRNMDIALHGQGAPLVPIGDALLFSEMDACINIGGIANVYVQKTKIAYDVCIANMGLNYFAQQLGKKYDVNGYLARRGRINFDVLSELNRLEFVLKNPPKSLNREYFERAYLPILQHYRLNPQDILSTLTEHIAVQISKSIADKFISKIMITGGGAWNKYLIERIKYYSRDKMIIIPDKTVVKYKEALVFALMGYLRILNMPNTIHVSTGAMGNAVSGDIVHYGV